MKKYYGLVWTLIILSGVCLGAALITMLYSTEHDALGLGFIYAGGAAALSALILVMIVEIKKWRDKKGRKIDN